MCRKICWWSVAATSAWNWARSTPRWAARSCWRRPWTAILAGADPDLARPVVAIRQKGVQGNPPQGEASAKCPRPQTDQGGDGIQRRKKLAELYDRVLVAVGRVPNSDELGLENTKVDAQRKSGFVVVNEQLQTNDRKYFCHRRHRRRGMLAHKAGKRGARRRREHHRPGRGLRHIRHAAVVYTDPEVAWCGLTEAEAKGKGVTNMRSPNFPGRRRGRALSFDRTDGVTKMHRRSRDGPDSGRGHRRRGRGRIDRRSRGHGDGRDDEESP